MKYLLSSLFLFISTSLLAQIQFEQISYRGSGCPNNTVTFAISPDEESISFIFDEFRSEIPNLTQSHGLMDLKSCALSFIASIPEGYKAEALEISLQARGFVDLDQDASALFASILVGYQGLGISRGRPTVIVQKHWNSNKIPFFEEFYLSPIARIDLNSGCSQKNSKSIRFDLKNHLKTELKNATTMARGLLVLDTIDGQGFLRMKIKKKRCGSSRMSLR